MVNGLYLSKVEKRWLLDQAQLAALGRIRIHVVESRESGRDT